MSLVMQLEEQKEKHTAINDAIFYIQSLLEVTQKVFSSSVKSTSELNEVCELWHKLHEQTKVGLDTLKTLIPSNVEKIEAE